MKRNIIGWWLTVCVAGQAAQSLPPGAVALGYTNMVINEVPTAADISPTNNGPHKWFSGQWYAPQNNSYYFTTNGTLAITLGGTLVSTPLDFSGGLLPTLPATNGFYVEFDVQLSDTNADHWPAVWLMPAEHNGLQLDHYSTDAEGYERWMELDVDEGGFGPGLTGTVHNWTGIYPNYVNSQNGNNVRPAALDRSQKHTFGGSYDPITQTVAWWLDGVKQMSAVTPDVPAIALQQHFYLIMNADSHGAQIPYTMYISGVRAYSSIPLFPAKVVNFITPGASWKYNDTGTDLGASWRSNTFNDTGWSNGPARLGFGGDGEVTTLKRTNSAGTTNITFYFRRQFYVTNSGDVRSLNARMTRDDGAVIYLNGAEIWRDNMGTNVISYTNLATASIGGVDETNWLSKGLNPARLITGSNTLAAEVHQVGITSSDIGFDFGLSGTFAIAALPKLNLGTNGPTPALRWPAVDPGVFSVFQSTNLTLPASWTPLTNAPTILNGLWVVPLPALSNGNHFYRLQSQ